MSATISSFQFSMPMPAAQAATFVPASVTNALAMHDSFVGKSLVDTIVPSTRPLVTSKECKQLAHKIDSLFSDGIPKRMKDKHWKAIEEIRKNLLNVGDNPIAATAAYLQGSGLIAGLTGQELDKSEKTLSWQWMENQLTSAGLLFAFRRERLVLPKGFANHDAQLQMALFAGVSVDDLKEIPPYELRTAKGWTVMMTEETGIEDLDRINLNRTEAVGKEMKTLLDLLMKFGLKAGAPRSLLKTFLHRRDIGAFAWARGYLQGIAKHLFLTNPEASQIISNNISTILTQAIASVALHKFVWKVIAAVEGDGRTKSIQDTIDTAIAQLEDKGKADTARILEDNKPTILYKAIDSGALHEFVRKVIAALEGDAETKSMQDEIDAAIKRLKDEGETDAAKILKDNKPTILCGAIASKALHRFVQKVIAAVEGNGKTKSMQDTIDTAIARLEEQGKAETAKILNDNKPTILHKAINSGTLHRFVRKVIAAVEGNGKTKSMQDTIDTAIACLEEQGKAETAKILNDNKPTILYKAINSGILHRLVRKVIAAVVGDGKTKSMQDTIDTAIARLEEQGETDAARILKDNKPTILYGAINSGALHEFVRKVIDAIEDEDSMQSKIEKAIESFRSKGDTAAARALSTYKKTILSQAIHSTRLNNFIDDVIEELKRDLDIEAAIAKAGGEK